MLRRTLSIQAVLAAVFAISARAASPAIGLVTASGPITINRSEVWGNATLFDGTSVETGGASSDLALRNGVRMQLSAGSRAFVWQNHLSLEKGASQVTAKEAYEVDAGDVRVKAGSGSRLRIAMSAGNRVEVVALAGSAHVNSRSGLLLAAIPAGHSLSFSLQSSGTDVTRAGCLLYKDSHFILQDDNTTEVIELSGSGLTANLGNRVEIVGTTIAIKPAVSIATLVMSVSSVRLKSPGGCLTVASALNAQTEAPAAGPNVPQQTTAESAKGGMSTGAKVGIAIAVIGGATGAAIAVASRGKSSTSP